jgi:hypothetical protein
MNSIRIAGKFSPAAPSFARGLLQQCSPPRKKGEKKEKKRREKREEEEN